MPTKSDIPLYQKFSLMTLGIIGFFFILYIGTDIIVPILFSLIFAILLDPIVEYFVKYRINRIIAILISILISFLLLAGLIYFLTVQIIMFGDMLPQLNDKFDSIIKSGTDWAARSFDVSHGKVNSWLAESKDKGITGLKSLIGPTIMSIGNVLVIMFLIPVYIFLILFYKEFFLEFVVLLFDKEKHSLVAEILEKSRVLIQKFLVGIIVETGLVGLMNVIGLFALGIQYSLLLGVIAALLNVIPYIGGIVAMLLILVVVLATEPLIYVLWVTIIFSFIQFVDNNIIMPKIVGSRVSINEFIAIVAVLVGSALWGIAGMFLSLPIIAILKVIFDRIDSLKEYGFLLGKNKIYENKKLLRLPKRRSKKIANTSKI
ncbi:hypothetical protein APF79_14295 [bacterium BRH_c32]|nr:MAG: hypothetical protein APF79_14295 [bacterium BRH_c32]